MQEEKIDKLEAEELAHAISDFSMFRGLTQEKINALLSHMTTIRLKPGETLIDEGSNDKSAYILVEGILDVSIQHKFNEPLQLAQISPGQIIGEFAGLANTSRTATVKSACNSLLLKFDIELFEIENHQISFDNLFSTAVHRAFQTSKINRSGNALAITVVPASQSSCTLFSKLLTKELNDRKPTYLIGPADRNHYLYKIQTDTAPPQKDKEEWIQLFRYNYGCFVFETDKTMTLWTQSCLKNADIIYLVGDSKSDPRDLNEIEKELFARIHEYPAVELIIFQQNDVIRTHKISDWLESRPVDAYHRFDGSSPEGIKRIVDILLTRIEKNLDKTYFLSPNSPLQNTTPKE